MTEQFDEQLKNWISGVAQGAEVSLAAPNGQRAGEGVGLYLLEVIRTPPAGSAKRPAPMQLSLRYLVTTWSAKSENAHQLLVQLMFAAMQTRDFEVEPESLPMTVWTAFGVPPLPSFILRMPLRCDRPEVKAKVVRQPLKITGVPLVSFHGLLLGPGETPLASCRIEIPTLHLWANTDYKGRFCFPAVPGEGSKQLLVKAKGRELAVTSEENFPDSRTPMVIHFTPLED